MEIKWVEVVGAYVVFPYSGAIDIPIRLLRRMTTEISHGTLKQINLLPLGGSANIGRKDGMTPENLDKAVNDILDGKFCHVSLSSYEEDHEWTKGYQTGAQLRLHVPDPSDRNIFHPALIEEFGWQGYILALFPTSWFDSHKESDFQLELMTLLKKAFVEFNLTWIFVNKGQIPVFPASVGGDPIFFETRDSIPLTSFDYDIQEADINLWKDRIKGAFWANLLSSEHTEKLGGNERIIRERPCSVMEDLGGGQMFLQVGTSPLSNDSGNEETKEEFQRLRRFLRPILMEENKERGNLQRQTISAWEQRKNKEAP